MSTHVTIEYFDNIDGTPHAIPIVFSVNGHYFEMALSPAHSRDFHADIKPWVEIAEEIDAPRMDLDGFTMNRRREFAREIAALAELESNAGSKEGLYIAARHLDPRISRTGE